MCHIFGSIMHQAPYGLTVLPVPSADDSPSEHGMEGK